MAKGKGGLIITLYDKDGNPVDVSQQKKKEEPAPTSKPVALPPGFFPKEVIDRAFAEADYDHWEYLNTWLLASVASGSYIEDPSERAKHLKKKLHLVNDEAWELSVASGIMATEYTPTEHPMASNGKLSFKCFVPAKED